jgi:hypothetical protein
VVVAPWYPPREFDYFCHISRVALEAGASVDDCEGFDIEGLVSGGGMFHQLTGFVLEPPKIVLSHAKTIKLQRVIAYYVEIGFPINYPNSAGETPFLDAAKYHSSYSTKYLQMLLDKGANPTAKDNRGRGALHLAIENFWEAVNSILFNEADSLGSDEDDASELDGGTDFAFSRRNEDETSLERYPDIDIGWPKSGWLQFAALFAFNAERQGVETEE